MPDYKTLITEMQLFRKLVNSIICLLALNSVTSLNAQQAQVGIGLGMNNYWGDLQTESLVKNAFILDPAFQLFYKEHMNEQLSIRFNLHIGKVHGDDANSSGEGRQSRNLNFNSLVTEFTISLEYALWDIRKEKYNWTPYAGVGVGIFRFNPKTEFLHPDGRLLNVSLQNIGTEGQGLPGQADRYSLTAFSIPVYGGLIFQVNDRLSVGLELILRYTTTDYLDDVSTAYFPIENFPNTEQGQLASFLSNRTDEFLGLPENDPMSIRDAQLRGSAEANDFFHSGMISIYYRLETGIFGRNSGGVDCYTF